MSPTSAAARLKQKLPEIANRRTSRAINRQAVVRYLLASQPISRAELSRRLGMQRSAMGRIVDDLIRLEIVYEGAAADTDRGRKPTLLHLDSRGRCAVAVDVRATRTSIVVTDLLGHELSPIRSIPTDPEPAGFIASLSDGCRRALASTPNGGRCLGVGIAFPGMLDLEGRTVVHAPALGWRDVPLREPLAEAIGLPVELENAAKACAFAIMWKTNGGGGPRDLVFVTVSDGVGVGLVLGGEILRGRHNVAGEFGHLPLSIEGPPCACGAMGCWEAYISNLATVGRYVGKAVLPKQPIPPEVASLTVEEVVQRARDGDARAMMALQSTARYLGLGLASIVNALDPDRICIGGEITAAWDLIEHSVRGGLMERVLVATGAQVELIPVAAEEHPRLKGASALIGAPVFREAARR